MAIGHSTNEKGNLLEIILEGKFTFVDNPFFNKITDNISNSTYKTVVIDLKAVEFIDSAALGILLLVLDKCKKSNTELLVKNPVGQVKRMFDISRLNDLLVIQED